MSSDTIVYQTKIKLLEELITILTDWIKDTEEDYSYSADLPEIAQAEINAYKSFIKTMKGIEKEIEKKFERRIR